MRCRSTSLTPYEADHFRNHGVSHWPDSHEQFIFKEEKEASELFNILKAVMFS